MIDLHTKQTFTHISLEQTRWRVVIKTDLVEPDTELYAAAQSWLLQSICDSAIAVCGGKRFDTCKITYTGGCWQAELENVQPRKVV
jgi:hypothetical protein